MCQVISMHAIGAGILVLETQQSSDTTYRVYDLTVRMTQGNLRERLHLEKSISVSKYQLNLLTQSTLVTTKSR